MGLYKLEFYVGGGVIPFLPVAIQERVPPGRTSAAQIIS